MIHVATVHWNTAKWVPIQQEYLRQHIHSPYRIYAWLNNVPHAPRDSFYYTCAEPVVSHAAKLNALADVVSASSSDDDDLLIFLDGDAFPVANIEPMLRQQLREYPLMAVQRLENNGDIQPHPCFCATTVAFWKRLRGDWNAGYQWQNSAGAWVSDVGGNLLGQLRAQQVAWYPLRRSNTRNLHPLFLAVYDHVVYHHGAGFREAWSRVDHGHARPRHTLPQRLMRTVLAPIPATVKAAIFNHAPSHVKTAVLRTVYGEAFTRNTTLSDAVFHQIRTNPRFWETLL